METLGEMLGELTFICRVLWQYWGLSMLDKHSITRPNPFCILFLRQGLANFALEILLPLSPQSVSGITVIMPNKRLETHIYIVTPWLILMVRIWIFLTEFFVF
jgi:hypothetical protein